MNIEDLYEIDDPYGVEDWEEDATLFYKEDWSNLLILREERAIKSPTDLYAQQ